MRDQNQIVDALSKIVTIQESDLEGSMYVEALDYLSTQKNKVFEVKVGPNWMTPIILFLE